MEIASRLPTQEKDLHLCTMYVSHPAEVDNTGRGVAKLEISELKNLGFTIANLKHENDVERWLF